MKTLLKVAILMAIVSVQSVFAEEEAIPERGGEGTVNIILKPEGSTVYLDGEEIGKSPIKNLKFRSGRHDLTVLDQEQELIAVRFNVWANKVNTYEGKTIMPFGAVSVTTNPSKCTIYIDGEHASGTDGAALKINSLGAGDHVVQAQCMRRNLEEVVKVEGEKTTLVHFDVRKRKVTIGKNVIK